MPRRMPLLLLVCICAGSLYAQDLAGIEIHGFVTQGFLFSSNNNYLTMQSSGGSLQWTDGAVSVSDSLTDKLRVGIQLHMYQLGQLGGANVQVDWASGDYRFNDYFGVRAGKVKTVLGLFNDSQDVDAVFLWILLPQGAYPIDNKSVFLSHLGGRSMATCPWAAARENCDIPGTPDRSTLTSMEDTSNSWRKEDSCSRPLPEARATGAICAGRRR